MYSILDFYSMHKRENSKEKRWKRKKRIKRKASPSARNPFIFLCTDTHRYRKKRKTKKKKKILKHGNRWNFARNPTGRKKKKGTRCLASSQFHFPPSEYPVDWIYKRNDISNIKIDDGWIFTIVTRGQDEREREHASFRGNLRGEVWCFAAFPPFNNTRLKDGESGPLLFEFWKRDRKTTTRFLFLVSIVRKYRGTKNFILFSSMVA